MAILVTGGAGYIGSHTCVELMEAGYDVIILDNLYNSKLEAVNRVCKLTGKDVTFYEGDVRDKIILRDIFTKEKVEAVIHFAGLKSVGESVEKPLEYYDNNITGTLVLCEVMREFNVKKIVFSSSATVYGMTNISPLREDMLIGGTTNPYGTTKYMIELILEDLYRSDNSWSICKLRYFNPVGAHKSGRIGEDPSGIPNNIMPYITQVAIGRLEKLSVFGDQYDTPDGTGVRDYIHVVDLACGHISALQKVLQEKGDFTYNLGTGIGYSVLNLVHAFEKASGKDIPYVVTVPRDGDLGTSYSDPEKARKELHWEATHTLDDMCVDSWRWQTQNPKGY